MITRLMLANIQCHEHFVFEPCSRVNVILGDNNKGKTSILRAVRWLAENRLRTTVMQKRGTKECRVTLSTNNSKFFARGFDKKANGNYYNTSGVVYKQDGTTSNPEYMYRAVGTTIPDRVKKELRLYPINFQTTSDPMFLIGLTPEQRYIYLMEQIGLDSFFKLKDKVDTFIKEAKIEERDITKKIEYIEDKQSQVNIKELEMILERIEKRAAIREQIEKINEELIEKRKVLEQVKYIKSIENQIYEIEHEITVVGVQLVNELDKGGLCPFCNSKLTVKHLAQILEEE